MFDNGMNYTCEQAVGNDRKCDFRVGSIILQQPVTPAQLQKLLRRNTTDETGAEVGALSHRPFRPVRWRLAKQLAAAGCASARSGARSPVLCIPAYTLLRH